ncbi:MAG: calcium-binding toxin-like protein, partial [Xanthomonadaceae bacterium]|nr:calcium-binding toxin-like protein [Xanthomonadaceae bacterium]
MQRFLFVVAAVLAASPAFAASAILPNDFDGDGRSDLLWRNADTGANIIWRDAVSAHPMSVQPMVNPDWRIAGCGDFDGDHHADILWRNRASGAMVIWYAGSAAR